MSDQTPAVSRRRAGGLARRSVLAGMPVDGADEAAPEDSVESLDAGVE